MEKGYNLLTVTISFGLWLSLSVSICWALVSYVNKHQNEPLTWQNTLKVALLWTGLKCIFILNSAYDFSYHHNWRMIMYNLPFDQAYERRCFPYDYPPLFLLYESFWGHILAYLSPSDMQFPALFRESLYFLFLMRLTVIVTDFLFFFSSLYLFRTLT